MSLSNFHREILPVDQRGTKDSPKLIIMSM
jgi:hypothetical protein